ncbi:MAG TPA: HAD family hydrolase [Candidatus Eisenbacteria bacterium]|nr:HAD family hydrolase [Candidatus Eisenbacteria bacterium]
MGIHDGDGPMNRAVFLDRDGVLNLALVRDGKPYSPANVSELQLAPGAAEALRELKELGFKLLVVTNQPEVARGNTTRAAVEEIHRKIASELAVDEIFVCYHQDGDGCECRKPRPGMLLEGARKYNVNPGESFMVGDRWRDVEAGQNAGCRTVFIDGGYEDREPARPADARVHTLREAVDWILAECQKGVVR